ncbi:hypothetical protein AYK21_04445 [Thermoplasmatales archaeon SG8-52-2]|nr:MAG: hypothetical protein AYK21_04445 [Thermoplasmatales archaeon SG8-52-2]
MKKKIIVIIIIMLFFISALPTINSSPNEKNDVIISITAGRVGLDFGLDIHIKVRKPEGIPMIFYVNITHTSKFIGKVDRLNWNFTCDEYQWGKIFKINPSGIFNEVNITVEANTIFGTEYYSCGCDGFSIGRLHFLNQYVPL